MKAYSFHHLYVVYVVEAYITYINWKAYYKYMNSFSSLLEVCIHFFFFINFLYIGFYFIFTHAHHFGLQWRVHPWVHLWVNWMAIQLNLTIDWLKIKANILYYTMPKLLTAKNHDTILNLACDCGVCYFDTLEAKIVRKVADPKN